MWWEVIVIQLFAVEKDWQEVECRWYLEMQWPQLQPAFCLWLVWQFGRVLDTYRPRIAEVSCMLPSFECGSVGLPGLRNGLYRLPYRGFKGFGSSVIQSCSKPATQRSTTSTAWPRCFLTFALLWSALQCRCRTLCDSVLVGWWDRKNSATHNLVVSLILFYAKNCNIYHRLQPRTRPRQPANLAEFWLTRFQLNSVISCLVFAQALQRQVAAGNSAWSRASARTWKECMARK